MLLIRQRDWSSITALRIILGLLFLVGIKVRNRNLTLVLKIIRNGYRFPRLDLRNESFNYANSMEFDSWKPRRATLQNARLLMAIIFRNTVRNPMIEIGR